MPFRVDDADLDPGQAVTTRNAKQKRSDVSRGSVPLNRIGVPDANAVRRDNDEKY